MNDLISRQAAIRWIKTECNPYGKPTLDFESGKKVIEYLGQMPSAQPEAKTPTWKEEDRFVKGYFTWYPYCPKCDHEVVTGQCYCEICGQHIDWSEEDG